MNSEPEFTMVESTFIDQFITIGWKLVAGNLDHASVTGRESFREIPIEPDLHKAIERNLNDCEPWPDEGRFSQVVSAPEVARIQKPRIMYCGVVAKLFSRRVQAPRFPTESGA
jgi:hypothetical protein